MANKVITTTINLEEQAQIILSLDEKIKELTELRKEKANEIKALTLLSKPSCI